jgi:hypothetical protein
MTSEKAKGQGIGYLQKEAAMHVKLLPNRANPNALLYVE